MISFHDEYSGPDVQVPYRNHKLGDAGAPLHQPGIIPPPVPSNIAFGKATEPKNGSVFDLTHPEPEHATQGSEKVLDVSESQYHRSKHKLGAVPDGVAVIPPALMSRGFGINTRLGEGVGAVVQGTLMDIPLNPTLGIGYQTSRDYDWHSARVNPVTHTFGIKGTSRIDHVTAIMNYDKSTSIVDTAVDRATFNCILPDPSPLNPAPSITAHTMRHDRLRDIRDPSERPPAGIATLAREFTIGDTFAGEGLITSKDADYQPTPRNYNPADEIRHGIRTTPNPFPNPLCGPGKYSKLGLSDEDFMKLRDKAHIVPIMVIALALSKEEAGEIFDTLAARYNRNVISVSEFHEEFKRLSYQ
jgi:hypothetical protein